MEVAVVVGLFLIREVGELGDPGVDPQPQLTLNSAVEEGYPWVGWQAGEVSSLSVDVTTFGGPGGIPLGGMGGGNEQLLFCTAVSSLATIASNSLSLLDLSASKHKH